MASLEAIVFDLGGVLIDIDFQRAFHAWARAAGVSPDAIAARFAVDEACFAHERGELDDAGYFAHLRSLLGIDIPDAGMLAGWNAIIGEPIPGIEALVRRAARQWPLYVFSNTNPAHMAHFTPRLRDLFGHFRAVFTSCEIGRRKPDPEAFGRLAARVGVDPAKIVFFDDVQANVQGARQAGLQAFRVTTPQEIEAALAQNRSAR